jgi:hypothetical protein
VAATADDTVPTSVYDRICALHFLMGSLTACRIMPSSTTGWDEALRAQQVALRQQLAEAAQRADAGVVDISVGIVRDAAQLLRDRATMCLRDVDRCAGSIAQRRIIRPVGGGRRPSASPAARCVARSR